MTIAKIPEDSDVFTLDHFIELVEAGGFIDYDGYGYYSDNIQMDRDLIVRPSEIKKGKIDRRFTHVVWFNR